ncbi:MAG: hypothetical protein ABSF03_14965 [Streptosporangiaceae bacterium]|jgi:hypothetical protein
MNLTAPVPGGILRLARWLAAAVAECNEAQRRLAYRALSYDQHLTEPDAPPQTYAEFLLRTSGPLRREPSARQRVAGRAVR